MELRTRLKDQVAAAFRNAQVEGAMGSALAAKGLVVDPASAPLPPLTGHPPPRGREQQALDAQSAVPSPSGEGGALRRERGDAPHSDALSNLTTWSFGVLPELLEVKIGNRMTIGFPALHDDGDSVSIRPFDTEEEAAKVHRRGLGRLFALTLKDQVKAIERLPGMRELSLQYMGFGSEAELKAMIVQATLSRTCLLDPLPANAEAFAQRAQDAKPRITLVAQELMRLAASLLVEHAAISKKITGLKNAGELVADIQQQLTRLMPKDFLMAFAFERLGHFARYLKAAAVRVDKWRNNPARDAELFAEWRSLAQPFEREQLAKLKAGVIDPQLDEFRWLLEELRVSLFAQELKTPMPVSVKRLQKIWESRPH